MQTSIINNTYPTVRVGVTVFITWNQKILLARRIGSHGANTWDTPGGHLEPGETVVECAIRETLEETNCQLDKACIQEVGFTEDFFEQENKHYISCVVRCEVDGNKIIPQKNEPHKIDTEWLWFDINELPEPLFIPVRNAITKYKNLVNFKENCSSNF